MNTDTIRTAILATHPDPDKKGRAFRVRFYKANGELRDMRARLGVRRNLTGKGLSYNPADYRQITVWELNNGYRTIPLDRLVSLRLPDNSKHLKEVLSPNTYISQGPL